MAKLTSASRNRLPAKDFAEPGERKYPIQDRSHAANAKARASGKPEQSKVDRAVARKYPGMGKKGGEREEGHGHAPRFDPKARYGKDGKRMDPPADEAESEVEGKETGHEGGKETKQPGQGRQEHAAGSGKAERGNPVLRDQEKAGARPALPGERRGPKSGPVRGDPSMEAAGSARMAAQPHLGGAPQPGADGADFLASGHPGTPEHAVKLALALRGRQAGPGPASRFPK
jgi:hypothetical protein